MKNFNEKSKRLQELFGTIAEQVAKQTGFVQRVRKITPFAWLYAVVLGWMIEKKATLEILVEQFSQQNIEISEQGISKRFTASTWPIAPSCGCRTTSSKTTRLRRRWGREHFGQNGQALFMRIFREGLGTDHRELVDVDSWRSIGRGESDEAVSASEAKFTGSCGSSFSRRPWSDCRSVDRDGKTFEKRTASKAIQNLALNPPNPLPTHHLRLS